MRYIPCRSAVWSGAIAVVACGCARDKDQPSPSSQATAVVATAPAQAKPPANLVAALVAHQDKGLPQWHVRLTWEAPPQHGTQGYRVYRNTVPVFDEQYRPTGREDVYVEGVKTLGEVPVAGPLEFTDKGPFRPYTIYFYAVRSYNSRDQSPASKAMAAVRVPAKGGQAGFSVARDEGVGSHGQACEVRIRGRYQAPLKIDWGDGTAQQSVSAPSATHTYDPDDPEVDAMDYIVGVRDSSPDAGFQELWIPVRIPNLVPSMPLDLDARPVKGAGIRLKWVASDRAQSYIVYRQVHGRGGSDPPPRAIAKGLTSAEFVDPCLDLAPGTGCSYFVFAVGPTGKTSPASNTTMGYVPAR